MDNKIVNLTEYEFYEKFNTITNHLDNNASFSGKMFETYGEELDFVIEMAKEHRVVTIIEGEGEEEDEEGFLIPTMYYSSGMHHVNRLGYLILDQPCDIDFEVKID